MAIKTSKTTTRDKPAPGALAKKPVAPDAPADSTRASRRRGSATDEPVEKKETLSLIEPVEKKVRTRPPAAKGSVLPPISRLVGPQPPSVGPEPEPEPAAAIEESAGEPAAPAAEEVDESKIIHIKPPIVVKDLAQHLELKPFKLISELMELGIFASLNQTIESDIASKICEKYGFVFEKEQRVKGRGVHKEEIVIEAPKAPEIDETDAELKPRAPIVAFMGHVDHGKTSLMDAIRKSRVVKGEAGGITQHIGAYSVEHSGHRVTFLDTPGHAAFTAMRARGAQVTDFVVLVVAADDGLMPQTIEAINHARAAKVKLIVALNKIDTKGADPDRVKGQLQEQGLTPEEWGGDTICVETSATKGTGIDKLLESIQLETEMAELKASRQADARGIVIEAQVEAGRGPTATIIVQMGILKVGQAFICGNHWGKVKSLIDDQGKPVKEAIPATPVKVLGFSGLPKSGDALLVMDSEKSAKLLGEERVITARQEKLAIPQRATLENLHDSLAEGKKKSLRIIIKSDVQGSMEAIVHSLGEIPSDKIDLNIVHAAVGPVIESDVLLATASDCVIIGFGVKVENSANAAARREHVQIKLFSIIYELIDQVKESMAGLLDPELRESAIGHAEVKQVFKLTKGVVAGCVVTDGRISRNGRARVLRKRQAVYDGDVATLRRFQDEVKEVRVGLECGIKLGHYTEYEVGDIIECYQLDKFPQQL